MPPVPDTRLRDQHDATARVGGFPCSLCRPARKGSFETEMAVGLVRRAMRLNLAELETLAVGSAELGATGYFAKPRQLLCDSQLNAARCPRQITRRHPRLKEK